MYGLVTGFNQPLSRWTSMFPTWLDPAEALMRRETAHLGYTLSTVDGGKTWVPGSQSILGHVTKVRLRTDGTGLGLVEHADSFRYPSEVYKLDWKTGKSETVFRDKRYALSDIWFGKDGSTYLAGIELQGTVRSVMPGRVRVFRPDLAIQSGMPEITASLKDPDGEVRYAAARAIGAIGIQAASAAASLSQATNDKSIMVQRAAARALHQVQAVGQARSHPERTGLD
jgi:hypothetical protein